MTRQPPGGSVGDERVRAEEGGALYIPPSWKILARTRLPESPPHADETTGHDLLAHPPPHRRQACRNRARRVRADSTRSGVGQPRLGIPVARQRLRRTLSLCAAARLASCARQASRRTSGRGSARHQRMGQGSAIASQGQPRPLGMAGVALSGGRDLRAKAARRPHPVPPFGALPLPVDARPTGRNWPDAKPFVRRNTSTRSVRHWRCGGCATARPCRRWICRP